MDDSNKQLLKTIEKKLDEFFANGTWRDGVKEEEVQDLIDFAEDLYDPFEGETISPIPEVNEIVFVSCRHNTPSDLKKVCLGEQMIPPSVSTQGLSEVQFC